MLGDKVPCPRFYVQAAAALPMLEPGASGHPSEGMARLHGDPERCAIVWGGLQLG